MSTIKFNLYNAKNVFHLGCRGNSNNFETYEDCMKVCDSPLESYRPPSNQFGRRAKGRLVNRYRVYPTYVVPV